MNALMAKKVVDLAGTTIQTIGKTIDIVAESDKRIDEARREVYLNNLRLKLLELQKIEDECSKTRITKRTLRKHEKRVQEILEEAIKLGEEYDASLIETDDKRSKRLMEVLGMVRDVAIVALFPPAALKYVGKPKGDAKKETNSDKEAIPEKKSEKK